MKKILLAFVLFFSLPAMAETTVCMSNNAGGEIHLLMGDKQYAISTSDSGQVVRGTWELLGTTKVLVRWEAGPVRIYDKSNFTKCEL